VPKQTVTPSAE